MSKKNKRKSVPTGLAESENVEMKTEVEIDEGEHGGAAGLQQDQSLANAKTELDSIPVATIGESRIARAADLTGSYMWLITLVCMLLAIALVWWSLPERGIAIDIHFPEGHGLEAEDTVRYRGIEVGVVEKVELNSELSGVDVKVNLKPSAESLAREGTRFWVVRPELSLAGISGLETAVGHKYIGLIPGDPDAAAKLSFDGLATSPPDALTTGGMEIIMRGEKKHSVSAGSPVTCRGVEIGRILSVGLSRDARFVDIRARIFETYTALVTTETKFWATSGVDFDFSFGDGMTLDMESLETIARGGVSMLTIENGGAPVKPGDVFALESKPQDDWYKKAGLVSSTDVKLRGVLPLEISWEHDGVLGDSVKQLTFNGIPFHDEAGKYFALVPADMLSLPRKGREGTLRLAPIGSTSEPLPVESASATEGEGDAETAVVQVFRFPVPKSFSSNWIEAHEVRNPGNVEACLVIRATGDPRELTYLHYPLEKQDISQTEEGWIVNSFDGDRDVWHGSPVLAASDGMLIGMLLIDKRTTKIVPVNSP